MKGKKPKLFGVAMALVLAVSLALAAVPVVPASADVDPLEWTEITIPTNETNVLLQNDWVGPIAVSPDGGTIFAGTYDGAYTLYRSDDDGYTWRDIATFPNEIVDIVVSPGWEDDDTVVVADLFNVSVSFDMGRNFVVMGNPGCMIMSMDATLDEEDRLSIVVGDSCGNVELLKYPVMTWTDLNAGLDAPASYVQDVRFSPNYANDGQILAMVYAYSALEGGSVTALITKFGDEIWNDYIGAAIFRDELGDSDWSFRADIGFGDDYTAAPMVGSLFVGIWGDLYWNPMDASASTALGDVWQVDFMPAPAGSVATDLNVRGRLAGITPTDTDVCSIAVDGDTAEATIMAGTESYNLAVNPVQMPVYVSSDGGSSWSAAIKSPSGMAWFNVEMGSPAAYCGSSGHESAFSVAIEGYGGLGWNQRGLIDTYIHYISDIRPSPGYATDETLFMVTHSFDYMTSSLWKTTDGGDQWERILTGGFDLGGGTMFGLLGIEWFSLVETPATFPTDPSVLVAQWYWPWSYEGPSLATIGMGWTAKTIWKSSDVGGLFTSKATARENITAWHVVSGTELWVADDLNDIWHSTDSGVTWTDPDDSEINAPIIDIEIPAASDILAGSVDGDVFISTDDGLTFEQLGSGPGASEPVVVAFDADYDTNSIIYAGVYGTSSEGIYRWEVGDSTSWEEIFDYCDTGDPEIAKLWSADDGTLYAVDYNNGVVWRSVNPTASPVDVDCDDPWDATPAFEPMGWNLDDGNGEQWWRLEVVAGSNIVFAVGEDCDGYPAVWVFEDTMSGGVTLVSPACGTTSGYIMEAGYWYGKARVMLAWEDLVPAEEYQFQVALDEDFRTLVNPTLMIGVGADEYTDGTMVEVYLPLGTTFYWRVRAYWPLYSQWSETCSLTTPLGPGAARPILESPASGQQDVALSPVLEWTGLIDATNYELMVAEDCDWTNLVVDKTGAAALEDVTVFAITADLEEGTDYCWKVVAQQRDDEGNVITESPWSDIGTFTTMTEAPAPVAAPTPVWVWVVIGIGAVLLIGVIVLIMRTRRPV